MYSNLEGFDVYTLNFSCWLCHRGDVMCYVWFIMNYPAVALWGWKLTWIVSYTSKNAFHVPGTSSASFPWESTIKLQRIYCTAVKIVWRLVFPMSHPQLPTAAKCLTCCKSFLRAEAVFFLEVHRRSLLGGNGLWFMLKILLVHKSGHFSWLFCRNTVTQYAAASQLKLVPGYPTSLMLLDPWILSCL